MIALSDTRPGAVRLYATTVSARAGQGSSLPEHTDTRAKTMVEIAERSPRHHVSGIFRDRRASRTGSRGPVGVTEIKEKSHRRCQRSTHGLATSGCLWPWKPAGIFWTPCQRINSHSPVTARSAHDSDFTRGNLLVGSMAPQKIHFHTTRCRRQDRGGSPIRTDVFSRYMLPRGLAARQPGRSLLQCGDVSNRVIATLRGFSCQLAPHPEATVGRRTSGKPFVVIIDFAARFSWLSTRKTGSAE